MSTPIAWTPDHDAVLRDNHEKGLPLSYAQVAAAINDKFGTVFSRNAAIGRAKRIGLCCLRIKGAVRRGPKRASTPAQRPDIARRKALSGLKPVQSPFTPRPDPAPGLVPLLDLASHGCRWPTGDRVPYLFCNEPQMDNEPYCADHCCLAYRIMERRQ